MALERVVAPKIVEANPLRKTFGLALFLAGTLAVAWYAYDFGRNQTLMAGNGNTTQDREADRRIEALLQEREKLKTQIVELERAAHTNRQELSLRMERHAASL